MNRHFSALIVTVILLAAGCQSSRRGMEFSGRVRDRDTAEPIGGATVTMTREILDSSNKWRVVGPSVELTSDADGRFRFRLPREQARNPNLLIGFDLRHPRYADAMGGERPMSEIRAAIAGGEQPWFADLEMAVGEEISGVIDDPHGRPIADCVVDYSPQGQRLARGRTKTDADGRFRFLVARGSRRNVAVVRPASFATQTFELFNRRGDVGRLRVRDGTLVTGIVRDERGAPVANTHVYTRAIGLFGLMTESYARTDQRGRYTLGPLMHGPHRLTVGDMRFAPIGITLRPQRATETFDLRPGELVTITFKVLDEAGRAVTRTGPYPRVSVNVAGYANCQWYNAGRASTDRNGVITLRVPKGLQRASANFTVGPRRALRWNRRDGGGGALEQGYRMALGTLTADLPQVVLTEIPDASVAAAIPH